MIEAKGWKDYRLLDVSAGERLEVWGDYHLIRPDPQVIWDAGKRHPRWASPDAHYHRSKTGGGRWAFHRRVPEDWTVNWNDRLTLKVTPTSFKHTGVFPEQAANWSRYIRLIRGEGERRIRVLNLFGYTGGATLACLSAGAFVCHVDASQGMVTQAKQNAALSGLDLAPARYIVDDCRQFVLREARRGNRYDAIIMDPPSYGRGPKGDLWKIEEHIYSLILSCAAILAENPLFFSINSYTTGLSPSIMGCMLQEALSNVDGEIQVDETGIPVEGSGLVLPAGGTALYRAKNRKGTTA